MALSSDQISLVRRSFAMVAPIADDAAVVFYDRLFHIAPSVRALFPDNLSGQRKKLMQALALAVSSLDRPEHILPILRDMGARHVEYGAEEDHYPVVGDTLLWTLEQGLGDHYTPEVAEAWQAAVTLVAQTMIQGARNAATTA